MRVPGRITLFGEAFGGLMERATVSVPTRQALAFGDDAAPHDLTQTYDIELDDIGPELVRLGFVSQVRAGIRGDLPMEFGLASSTALALVHLGRREGAEVEEAIAQVDGAANGFPPSGADSAAVRAGEPGVFGLETWSPLSIALPEGSHLLLPEKDRLSDKLRPTLAMRAARPILEPLIRSMVDRLERGGGLDLDGLLDYARVLLDEDVYSQAQAEVIRPLLDRGIVAKGVGAMYDRAILVFADVGIWDGNPPMTVVPQ